VNDELDKLLCRKFPGIFRDRYESESRTIMCRGFEHDDGWFEILDCGLHLIQCHIDSINSVAGSKSVEQVVATQVKEKFGSLRFYYDGGDEYIQGVFDMMREMSDRTCEVCGEKGRIRTTKRRWLKTLCDKHAEENRIENEKRAELNNQI
jgi:hypothetical protein